MQRRSGALFTEAELRVCDDAPFPEVVSCGLSDPAANDISLTPAKGLVKIVTLSGLTCLRLTGSA